MPARVSSSRIGMTINSGYMGNFSFGYYLTV